MEKTKLKYKFIDPNAPEKSAEYIFQIFIEASKNKVVMALQESADSTYTYKEQTAACENS